MQQCKGIQPVPRLRFVWRFKPHLGNGEAVHVDCLLVIWGDASRNEAGRVDGGQLFQTLAFMTEESELWSAGSGEPLKGVKQGNDSNCVLERNEEGSFTEVKGMSWNSSTDNVDGRPELKRCGRQKRGGRFKRDVADITNTSLSTGIRQEKQELRYPHV